MPQGISNPTPGRVSVPGYTAFDGGIAGKAHNEAAFRHLLQIELRRAARSGHCVLLVLVRVRDANGRSVTFTPVAASHVFSTLGASVREVDFIGWFKDGRVAAAALVQRAVPTASVRLQIASRVMKTLQRNGSRVSGAARVRVVALRGIR